MNEDLTKFLLLRIKALEAENKKSKDTVKSLIAEIKYLNNKNNRLDYEN